METNSQIKTNFDGGDLSSDAGLLLFKEFLFKIGAVKLINRMFKTNDTAWFRIHKDDANLMQVIYQIISAYFEDDCEDELTNKPVMTAILEKDTLAFQPTLLRFFNRMDQDTLVQLNQITHELRRGIYSIKKTEFMLLILTPHVLIPMGIRKVRSLIVIIRHTAIIRCCVTRDCLVLTESENVHDLYLFLFPENTDHIFCLFLYMFL